MVTVIQTKIDACVRVLNVEVMELKDAKLKAELPHVLAKTIGVVDSST